MANVQAKHDKISKVVGTAVCTGMLAAGWALLVASSAKDFKTTVEAARQVPSLYDALKVARANEIPPEYVAVPLPVAQARIWRKLPSVSKLEGDMLTIAVFAEAGNQPKAGMQAVASAILNRTGTKHGLTLAEVIRAPKQFSFVNVTTIGKLIGRNSQEAIEAEARKPQYDTVRKALVSMIDPKANTYADYAAGTDYYYNPAASSPGGKQWFASNTVPVMRIKDHVFCKAKV